LRVLEIIHYYTFRVVKVMKEEGSLGRRRRRR
jgi:hypothetical protein